MRREFILICEECLSRNYRATKPQQTQERFEVKKFCPHCNRHTLHKETK